VPACEQDGAGMRRHLNERHAALPYSGAAESFVSFIPLFDGASVVAANGIADQRASLAYDS
jgi:hypothetical protein